MTLMTPIILKDLYNYDPLSIGLWLLPFGIGAVFGSISGGSSFISFFNYFKKKLLLTNYFIIFLDFLFKLIY